METISAKEPSGAIRKNQKKKKIGGTLERGYESIMTDR